MGLVPDEDYILPLGKARVVRRGRDVTLVTHLLGVSVAVEAASILASRGIEVEIIDLLTLYRRQVVDVSLHAAGQAT